MIQTKSKISQTTEPRYRTIYSNGKIYTVDMVAHAEAMKEAMIVMKRQREEDTERTAWLASFGVKN